jgi:putative colanic acid biosynthesis acetyltransferase WcaF
MNEIYIKYKDSISIKNKIKRKVWLLFYFLFIKYFSSKFLSFWRNFILRLFGAKIGKGTIIYSSSIILAPWNFEIGEESCIGPNVKFHIGKTIIGSKVTVSQGTYLCSGSHEINSINTPFITKPILINDYAWVAAETFIMMGVEIGEGAIIGARAVVFRDVEPWTVVGGNPASFIKKRQINENKVL